MDLIQNADSSDILRYKSALTNNDLKREGSWNLIYPQEEIEIIAKKGMQQLIKPWTTLEISESEFKYSDMD